MRADAGGPRRSRLGRVKAVSNFLALCSLARGGSCLRTVGWFRSWRERSAVDRDGKPIPWLTYAAIALLEARVRREMRLSSGRSLSNKEATVTKGS